MVLLQASLPAGRERHLPSLATLKDANTGKRVVVVVGGHRQCCAVDYVDRCVYELILMTS